MASSSSRPASSASFTSPALRDRRTDMREYLQRMERLFEDVSAQKEQVLARTSLRTPGRFTPVRRATDPGSPSVLCNRAGAQPPGSPSVLRCASPRRSTGISTCPLTGGALGAMLPAGGRHLRSVSAAGGTAPRAQPSRLAPTAAEPSPAPAPGSYFGYAEDLLERRYNPLREGLQRMSLGSAGSPPAEAQQQQQQQQQQQRRMPGGWSDADPPRSPCEEWRKLVALPAAAAAAAEALEKALPQHPGQSASTDAAARPVDEGAQTPAQPGPIQDPICTPLMGSASVRSSGSADLAIEDDSPLMASPIHGATLQPGVELAAEATAACEGPEPAAMKPYQPLPAASSPTHTGDELLLQQQQQQQQPATTPQRALPSQDALATPPLSVASTALTTPDRDQQYASPAMLRSGVAPGGSNARLSQLVMMNSAFSPQHGPAGREAAEAVAAVGGAAMAGRGGQGSQSSGPGAGLAPIRLAFGSAKAPPSASSQQQQQQQQDQEQPACAAQEEQQALSTGEVGSAAAALGEPGPGAAPGQGAPSMLVQPPCEGVSSAPVQQQQEEGGSEQPACSGAELATPSSTGPPGRLAALARLKCRSLQRQPMQAPACATSSTPEPLESSASPSAAPTAAGAEDSLAALKLRRRLSRSLSISPGKLAASRDFSSPTNGGQAPAVAAGSGITEDDAPEQPGPPGDAGEGGAIPAYRPHGARRWDSAMQRESATAGQDGSCGSGPGVSSGDGLGSIAEASGAADNPMDLASNAVAGGAAAPPKPFLRRRSHAVVAQKLPDWSQVRPRTQSHLDPDLVPRSSTPRSSSTPRGRQSGASTPSGSRPSTPTAASLAALRQASGPTAGRPVTPRTSNLAPTRSATAYAAPRAAAPTMSSSRRAATPQAAPARPATTPRPAWGSGRPTAPTPKAKASAAAATTRARAQQAQQQHSARTTPFSPRSARRQQHIYDASELLPGGGATPGVPPAWAAAALPGASFLSDPALLGDAWGLHAAVEAAAAAVARAPPGRAAQPIAAAEEAAGPGSDDPKEVAGGPLDDLLSQVDRLLTQMQKY